MFFLLWFWKIYFIKNNSCTIEGFNCQLRKCRKARLLPGLCLQSAEVYIHFLSLLFYPLIDKFREKREKQKNLRNRTGSATHENVV